MATLDSPSTSGLSAEVDPYTLALRVSPRPLDHVARGPGGVVRGHYRGVGVTTAAAPAAASVLAALRFVPGDSGGVLAVLRVWARIVVVTAVTAQRNDPLALFVARSYTVSETTNAVAAALSRMRSNMNMVPQSNFLVATAAAGLTGGTKTLDSNSIGEAMPQAPLAGLGTGMVVTDLFRANTDEGQYPLILNPNEGLVVQWGATALGTGTVTVGIGVEVAELPGY